MSLTVAWISDYPIEWMPDLPPALRALPRQHPASWMAVLLGELETNPDLKLYILVLRRHIETDYEFEKRGVRFHVLNVPGVWRAPSLFWVDTLVIRRALKRIRPDVVHAWGSERGCGIIASRLGCPYLVTMQGILTWYRERVPLGAYQKLVAFLEAVSLRRAPLVTTESRFAVEYLRRRYPELAVRQIEHAPHWVFHHSPRHPQTRPIRFITGSLSYRKGSDLLLRALNELRTELDFELVVVGERNQSLFNSLSGAISPELERRIRFKTDLLPAEVALELSTATIMVLPTRADTSPNSVKEAVVAGVPVIASRVGGIPDYVVPEKNGLLFGSENLLELVQTIRTACRHPLFGQGLVDAATLAQMREYLSPALMGGRFTEVYRFLAANKGTL